MKKSRLMAKETHSVMLDSDVIVIKEVALRMAKDAGFPRKNASELAIVAAELCTNIVKHVGAGFMHFQVTEGDKTTMWITAEDHGPGIECKKTALKDFHTDRGSIVSEEGFLRPMRDGIGCGLSAVKRLVDHIEIATSPGAGTVVIAIKSFENSATHHHGSVTRAYRLKRRA